jgi:predicted membrane-bound spermidine synthase
MSRSAILNSRAPYPGTALVLLFFLSGFSALLYQVIWQRMLGLFSGVDVYSVTIIVSAFMLGMGIGSSAGGYLADKLPQHKLIGLFALSEMMIALFALISKWFYYDVLYQTFPGISSSFWVLGLVLFFSLLLPTFFMGITLPLLSRALVQRVEQASTHIGLLYAVNTLGAATGALVTSVYLIRQFGFERSIQIGAALNLVAMSGALLLGILCRRNTTDAGSDTALPSILAPPASQPAAGHHSYRLWLLVYALSGFIALGLEIIWFRILGVMLKSTAFTFGILLFIYLLGLVLGTCAAIRTAPRSRHPQRVFFLSQAGIVFYAILSLVTFMYFVDKLKILALVWNYFAAPINFPFAFHLSQATPEFCVMYFMVAPLLILPSTLLMGFSFPYLQQVIQSDVNYLGKRVGYLQTANIMGSTLGGSVVGLILLDKLGTIGSLKVLCVLSGVYLWMMSRQCARQWVQLTGYGVSVLLVAVLVLVLPTPSVFWGKLYGIWPGWMALHAEDNSGVAFIKATRNAETAASATYQGVAVIYINGAAESNVPYGDQHTALSLVASMIHPSPKDILIIGLGSGDTAYSAAGRPETESVTDVEILAAQFPNLQQLHRLNPYAGLDTLFHDPRFHFVFTDARTWLMRSNKKFDIIEADPLRPNMAYAGNLYSVEYFSLLKEHLKPGGYAVSWVPSNRTASSFRSVFPYTLNIGYWMFIGSNQPIVVDRDVVMQRARLAAVQAYYQPAGVDAVKITEAGLDKIVDDDQSRRTGNLDVNSDLFPKDEYERP